MRKTAVLSLIIFFGAICSNIANAAGFRIGEQDARSSAMGNAFVAVADNPSAAWYNPAATVFLKGNTNVSFGTVMLIPRMEHYSETTQHSDLIKSKVNYAPHVYGVRKLSDKMSVSLSVNAPFGMATNWRQGAYTSTTAVTSDVRDINFNINLAYKVTDNFSLAVGANAARVSALLTKMYQVAPSVYKELKIDGVGYGYSYNVAAMYKPTDKWTIGSSFRRRLKSTVTGGNAKIDEIGYKVPVEADLTIPDIFQIGVSYTPNEKWLFSAEADYTHWSTYDQILFKRRDNGSIYANDPKDWKNVWGVRAGTAYKMNERWKMRGGVFYDWNPVRDERFETRVPDSDRISVSVGFTYEVKDWTVDFSYCHVRFFDRKVDDSNVDSTIHGKYYATASVPSLTVGYRF